MDIGVIVPQGVDHEYDGWDASAAWERSVQIAQRAESLGFESIWLYDHFHTDPLPTEEITFEAMTMLTALATHTARVRLGHLVLGAGYRNPALVAKMASTIDVTSGGRFELGLGAGWKRDEYEGYGYDFPATRERLARLRETLEIVTRLLREGRATFAGEYLRAENALNVPRGLQEPHLPVLVGGNGPEVTWRLAAAFADELNLDGLTPDEVRDALPTIAARCAEVGRDPKSLRVSVHLWGPAVAGRGQERAQRMREYRTLGVTRVVAQLHEAVTDLTVLDGFRDDATNVADDA